MDFAEDSALLYGVKDSLRRQVLCTQIVEVRKLVERAQAAARAAELDLRKQREQKVAQMIIRVLKLGKVAELHKECLAESSDVWSKELAAMSLAVEVLCMQEFEERLVREKQQRLKETENVLGLLPLEPIVIQNLRAGSELRARVAVFLAEEETTGVNPEPSPRSPHPETTLTDRHLTGVLSRDIEQMLSSGTSPLSSLQAQLQSVTSAISSHIRATGKLALHQKAKSCSHPVVIDLREEGSSRSFLLDLEAGADADSRDEAKDSIEEEEANRLAILNSSVIRERLDQPVRVNKSVEVQEKDFESPQTSPREVPNNWKQIFCRCFWPKALQ